MMIGESTRCAWNNENGRGLGHVLSEVGVIASNEEAHRLLWRRGR
jgi:hypothetical protein